MALVVVLIPDELQINAELQRRVRQRFYPQIADADWDPQLPNRRLRAELDALGIAYIDLYPDFVSSAVQPLYRPRDSHWNIAGNRLAAKVIARDLAGRIAALRVSGALH